MEKERNGKNILIGVLIAIIIILVGLCIYFAFIKKDNGVIDNNAQENNEESNNINVVNTFTNVYPEEGIATVTGYATIAKLADCMGECMGNEPQYDYVFFTITDTSSSSFLEYIKQSKGNWFVSDNGIGLGCLENGIIKYNNNSDVNGYKSYTLSNGLSNDILNSSKNHVITLELEKLKLSYGGGADVCYSHITNVKKVK